MNLKPHSKPWYDRLATLQDGYYYPWQSQLGMWNGEDDFLPLVRQHLREDTDLFEVACAQGQAALALAPHCRSVLAYDRIASYIDLAQQAAKEKGLTNVTFVCHDSGPDANDDQANLLAPDNSADLLICSKGPFHWIEDAGRVARPGAVLLMLVPDGMPVPPWHEQLPEPLHWQPPADPYWTRPAIEQRLEVAGLTIHSWWSFEVPELFPDPEQMYVRLTWGHTPDEVPALTEVRPVLEQIFAEYGTGEGVAVQHRRYIWKSVAPS